MADHTSFHSWPRALHSYIRSIMNILVILSLSFLFFWALIPSPDPSYLIKISNTYIPVNSICDATHSSLLVLSSPLPLFLNPFILSSTRSPSLARRFDTLILNTWLTRKRKLRIFRNHEILPMKSNFEFHIKLVPNKEGLWNF